MLNVLAKATVHLNRLDMEDRDIAGTAAYICESTTAVSYRHPCYCPEKSPILASDGFRRLCVATSTVLPTRSLKDKTATSSSRPVSTKSVAQSSSSTSHTERALRPIQPPAAAQASSSTAQATSSAEENASGSNLSPTKPSSQHSERQTEATPPVATPAASISAPDAPLVTAQQAPATDLLLPMAAAELVISDPALSSPLVVSMVQGFQRLAAFTETTLTEHNIALPEPRNSWVMVQLLSEQIHAALQELEAERRELEAERQRHAETRSQLQRAYAALAIAKTAISAYVSSAVGSMLESAMG
ncbi:hypothetical protein PENSPDRAFT_355664 [Peniophora sp. CONT]|nr:hypothetical protein PENSPDRAFT_355664 [Peniophora sp. CONT]